MVTHARMSLKILHKTHVRRKCLTRRDRLHAIRNLSGSRARLTGPEGLSHGRELEKMEECGNEADPAVSARRSIVAACRRGDLVLEAFDLKTAGKRPVASKHGITEGQSYGVKGD